MNQVEQFIATLAGDAGAAGKVPATVQYATANPAANNEVAALTVPSGKLWEPLLYTVSLAQGITQTPWPSLVFDDGTNIIAQMLSGSAAQNASVTAQHTWGIGLLLAGGGAGVASHGGLPRLVLPAGYRIRTLTGGIGANSDYGAARLLVKEYA
jgi:hypothetical protein